jgi:cholesterol oxidase
MQRLSNALTQLKPRYDVVVVGSGYGGGVAASRLARAGKQVAVLERGREFLTGEFPSRFPEMRREMQVTSKHLRTGAETALFDVRVGEDMHVLVGCGLGGGSLVNAGVALRPDARVFADAVWPRPVIEDGLLEEGFARARAWLRPARDPGAQSRVKYQALEQCGSALGAVPIAPEVVVSFAPNTNPAGIEQPACTLCGDCCAGCNVGAKNTVALTYLSDAHRHGAEIFVESKVHRVAKAREGGWVVFVEWLSAPRAAVREVQVTADIVVLAAGTLGSTEILLRSREHGLPLSDRLGERFSANGDIIAFGYGSRLAVDAIGVGHPPKVDGLNVGTSVSGQIELRDAVSLENEICVQEGAIPSALAPVLPVMFLPNGRLLGALQSLVSGVYKGPFAHLQTFFAVSHDSAGGKLRLEGDGLVLSWPGVSDEPVHRRLDAVLGALVGAGGGRYVKNPLAGSVMGHQPATAHPLGGCAMGEDGSLGVVDHKCRVFTGAGSAAVHDGLYVIDGAIIPRSLGVNPLLTITALAERALLHLVGDRGLGSPASQPASSPPA